MSAVADAIIARTQIGDAANERWAVLSVLASLDSSPEAGAALLAGDSLPAEVNAELLVLVASQQPALPAVDLVERVVLDIRFALAHPR